jgi:hypothetical protein
LAHIEQEALAGAGPHGKAPVSSRAHGRLPHRRDQAALGIKG